MEFDNLKKLALYVKNTPLPGYTFPNFLFLLAQNKFKIDAQYIPRMIYSLTFSTIMLPFYIKDRIQFDTRMEQTEITHPPLFIIGHWRSGTTYLHNVLAQDKNLGYFTTFQAYLPGVFLGSEKLFKPLVSASIPKKKDRWMMFRWMQNILWKTNMRSVHSPRIHITMDGVFQKTWNFTIILSA